MRVGALPTVGRDLTMHRDAHLRSAADSPVDHGRRVWLPAIGIFLLGALLTALLWSDSSRQTTHKAGAEFDAKVQRVLDRIATRVTAHEQVLRGVVGLFNGSSEVRREDFRNYVSSLRLEERYPGIQGVGFSLLVPAAGKAAHIERIRHEGFRQYDIRPAGGRELHTSIIYLEPFDWRNQRAFGYDMFSEPTRNVAMRRAMETGKAALSGKVRLAQETESDVQPGVLLYVPIYRHEMAVETPEQRTANLIGWAYSPLRMKNLMGGLFGEELGDVVDLIRFTIYDSEHAARETLLYDSVESPSFADASYLAEHSIELAGRTWTVSARSLPAFDSGRADPKSGILLGAGLIISALAAAIAAIVARGYAGTRAALDATAGANRELQRSVEEKRAIEDTLRATLREQQAMIDNPLVGIAKIKDGQIDRVNEAFLALVGYRREELQGRQATLVCPAGPPSRGEGVPATAPPRNGNAVWRGLVSLRHKDGRYLPVQLASAQTAEGQSLWAVVDETEWRLAKEQVRRLSQAVEQTPNSIVITNVHGEIEYVNAAFTRISGYTLEEVRGRSPGALRSGDTPSAVVAAMWAALKRGEDWRGEFINRRKDGEALVEYEIVTPMREPDGRITHYLAIKEDVTEKKRIAAELDAHRYHLEEMVVERTAQLADAQRAAEEATRAKSAFLANMSHEIRTPMNAILGMTHLLRRGELQAKQLEQVDMMAHAAQHLLRLVDDVLDISKIEAGMFVVEELPLDAEQIPAEVRALIADRAAAKGLALKIDTGGLPRRLLGDPTRLTQALLNLAANAVKFTERGSITLRARVIDTRDDCVCLRFEVEDTGIGVPLAAQARLFRSFEQADTSTTRQYGGTGLGLAFTKRIAMLMGGDAGLISEPGVGSTFWFNVWLRKDAEPDGTASVPAGAADAEQVLRQRFRGTRVLLAEDDLINQIVACEMIRDIGLEVDTATNGREAVAMARRNDYALVLMDMQMPVMDGLEAARELRRNFDAGSLPIIAMTANAFAADREHCIAAGMDDFISKPCDPSQFYATLLRWLKQKKVAAPA